ncbi:hypothetical protein [Kitasatospora sp. NPDC097643]|uniref:hypothetical protein n=1 Tax=Kitasatospora sp. NPDC097643 TaxID=3157230 RepID=UPI00332768A4
MRSGRLLGLDADAVDLAAVGLVRLAVDGCPAGTDGTDGKPGTVGGPAWLWRMRAAAFADTWLALGELSAPGLRVPATAVVRSIAFRAAELVLQARRGDGPAALEWLGRRSAQAREQAAGAGVTHPAEPAAFVLVWHGIQAIGDEEWEPHEEHIATRCEAYVRQRHHRQDTLALMLACARIAATALVELSDGDPSRAGRHLEEYAERYMPRSGPVPPWVPGRPTQPAG